MELEWNPSPCRLEHGEEKSSTGRAISKPATRTTNAATNARARNRTFLAKSSTMLPEPSPPKTTSSGPERSRTVPIRQSSTSSRTTSAACSRIASPQRRSTGLSPPLGSRLEVNSPSNGGRGPTSTTRRQLSTTPSTTVKGINSTSSQVKKQIFFHGFLTKTTPKSRGPSMLTCSIDETAGHQLRRHSALSKPQDYVSKSHDHGSLASYRGPKSLSTSQDRGHKAVSKSHNHGPMSLSKSQDRGLLSCYVNQRSARKVTLPAYGFDGRRLSTGSADVTSHAHRISDIKAHYQGSLNRRDGVSLQSQMGRSVDSTVSLFTATSSQRQSFRDTYSERSRLSPLQLSDAIMSDGYRSGDLTPEETSPLDVRLPESGLRTRHRQLKSPDFFDVKKVDGDVGGVITAVSRMHHKSDGVGQRAEGMGAGLEPEDLDAGNAQQHLHSNSDQSSYSGQSVQSRRDSLAGSIRKAFSAETDSAIGSSHFSEINYKLEKELSGAQELLEIGSWNEDDEAYLRIYKGERSAVGSFVNIFESAAAVSKSSRLGSASTSPNKAKKWVDFSIIPGVGQYHGQYDNALYEKSEPKSDLDTSTQPCPQGSPPRGSADRATSAIKAAVAVSRISSMSATSIDLNRSTDTTCSADSQYDNAFWGDASTNGTFRPWNSKREAEMTPAVAPTRSSLKVEPAHAQESSVVGTQEPAADTAALGDGRMPRYSDGLEWLTSYMKTASQSACKKRGLSDDQSSSQASGCFDYLVDFLESQQSITNVLVSAHDQTLKNDFALSVAGNMAPKRLDASKVSNNTPMLSSRSIESRITHLGSEASWELGKSRSVQTLGATGKVMDQISEKISSLSFDSPKHLSTFKFGLKKTTVGAFETITSSDQVPPDCKPNDSISARSSRAVSERSFPQCKPQVSCPQSPNSNLSWRSQTTPNSHNMSRNPSRTPSRRTYSEFVADEKLPGIVESRREEKVLIPAASPSMSDKTPVTEFLRKESPRMASPGKVARQTKKGCVEKIQKAAEELPASPTVEVPLKDVQMHSRCNGSSVVPKLGNPVRLVECGSMKGDHSDRSRVKHDRDSCNVSLEQANKSCGCNIL
ncbi:hypothetical protein KC19_VG261900 [Ceratodon purpureus]|uniref:Uncharacterized protein n=1 Tax=Ceratodon purpureus TaxID=3225 RepID=A0A8T0HVE1_CERPU|nr:hypothetical protein KC19_VG261900 [Ceratodon purpureus]KAG0574428.1 hypothetical protein KC19_VG261900 [Ceratodon purpureus]KAG0574429.1 hypothetical protein KC19_VG261900 [Ceratodon purpureus]